jgi:hypothetical protein
MYAEALSTRALLRDYIATNHPHVLALPDP